MEHSGLSRSGLVKVFRRALREGVIFALLAIINPFEIISWSDQRSHELWEKIAAHDYPASGGNILTSVGAPARDDISLVYFDDASVRRQFEDKPLDSFGLLDLIDDIRLTGADQKKSDLENAPAAILVDMVLDDAAPEGVTAAALLDAVQPQDATHLEAARCEARSPTAAPALSPFQCLVIRVAQLTKYHIWQNDQKCFENSLAKLRCIHQADGLPLIFVDPKLPMAVEKRTSVPEPTVAHTVLDKIAILSPATIDVYNLRIPTKPATYSGLKPATVPI